MRRRRFVYLAIAAAILLALLGLRARARVRTKRVVPPPFAASDAMLDESYVRLNTLEDARSLDHTAVVMRGGEGEQMYLTAPVKYVSCDAPTLRGLSIALDTLAYKDPERVNLTFELAPIGSGVVAGKEVGSVVDGVWLHPRFEEAGVSTLAVDVVEGRRTLDEALSAFPNAMEKIEDDAR